MANDYFAPGVYVEEVPSAQQPIAGVGTSTAAFIGIVPDKIQYPVLNKDYIPPIHSAEDADTDPQNKQEELKDANKQLGDAKDELERLRENLLDGLANPTHLVDPLPESIHKATNDGVTSAHEDYEVLDGEQQDRNEGGD